MLHLEQKKIIVEDIENDISTNVTLASSIEELEQEVETLNELEEFAYKVYRSGQDTKWNELRKVFEENILARINPRK